MTTPTMPDAYVEDERDALLAKCIDHLLAERGPDDPIVCALFTIDNANQSIRLARIAKARA